jgi:integrase
MQVLERRRREAKEGAVFVFPASSRTGHISDIKKKWFEFRKRAGIPDVRLHDLRRTKGSYAALSGESLQKIAAVLGHKSLGSTQIYARLNEESARKTSLASDQAMQQMMKEARKRAKRVARRPNSPKLLGVANG